MRHIRLLKNQLSLMEDELPDASIDELVEHCVGAKVRRQTFDGYSPLQWWFGTQRAREVEEQGLGDNRSSFERRLQFQTAAQTAFVRARKTLRMAQYARSRVLRNPTVGTVGEILPKEQRWGGWRSSWWKDGFLVLQEYLQLNSQRRWSHKSQLGAFRRPYTAVSNFNTCSRVICNLSRISWRGSAYTSRLASSRSPDRKAVYTSPFLKRKPRDAESWATECWRLRANFCQVWVSEAFHNKTGFCLRFSGVLSYFPGWTASPS